MRHVLNPSREGRKDREGIRDSLARTRDSLAITRDSMASTRDSRARTRDSLARTRDSLARLERPGDQTFLQAPSLLLCYYVLAHLKATKHA